MLILLLLLITFVGTLLSGEGLPDVYHNPDEVREELFTLQEEYPQIAYVKLIGYSEKDSIPFYGIHITDNPEIEEEEPGFLLLGQCHAEEVLGVEISLFFARELCEKYQFDPHIRTLVRECSIWIIPTYNPEGLWVVHDSLDVTYRKNKRDNNGNGIFDYEEGIGYDIDGVDLNRNYDFHWIHGDGYLTGDYDYYRGPGPFSESETRAIRDFVIDKDFIFSVAYHSARTGTPEIIYYPWDWGPDKRSPDFEQITELANQLASRILRENGVDHYRVHAGTSRKGNAHNWFYGVKGVFQFLIECGTHNLQPDSTGLMSVIQKNLPGLYFLLDRMIGYEVEAPLLTGRVKDQETNQPLPARVEVEGLGGPSIHPRTASPITGRFWRVLVPGSYNLRFSLFGYQTVEVPNFTVQNSFPTFLEVSLPPLPERVLSLSIQYDQKNSDSLTLRIYQDSLLVIEQKVDNGNFSFRLPEGEYRCTLEDTGRWFYSASIPLFSDTTAKLIFHQPVVLFEDDFATLSGWLPQDTLNQWFCLDTFNTDVLRSNQTGFYQNNLNTAVRSRYPFFNPDTGKSFLIIRHRYETEAGFDSLSLELTSPGSEDNVTLYKRSGIKNAWFTEILPLDSFRGDSVYLTLRLKTDASLNDPGWFIDWIKAINYSTRESPWFVENQNLPEYFSISEAYPNPFNSRVSFLIYGYKQVEVQIFNLKGELIEEKEIDLKSQRRFKFVFNGEGLPSGLYLIRFNTEKGGITRKCLLLK